jgi:hypothetical protein
LLTAIAVVVLNFNGLRTRKTADGENQSAAKFSEA